MSEGILFSQEPGQDLNRLHHFFSSQCVRKNSTAGGHNDIKNLGVIRYHPEIEDVIRPVGVAPLDLPTDDQITHTVADIVLAVNDEHYSVLYLGTGTCACTCVFVSASVVSLGDTAPYFLFP